MAKKKEQVNLDAATIGQIQTRADELQTSRSAVMRALILAALNGGVAIIDSSTYKGEGRNKPTACPECGATDDGLGSFALLFTGKNKWQCYVCQAKGTY